MGGIELTTIRSSTNSLIGFRNSSTSVQLIGPQQFNYNNNNKKKKKKNKSSLQMNYYMKQQYGSIVISTTTKNHPYSSTTPTFMRTKVGAQRGRLEAIGIPTSVPVRVAHELLLAGHRYLDVRTPEEFSGGYPVDAINIPYMHRVGSEMTKNPKFVEQVASHFRKYDEIIVGCQSGKRSIMAATDLLASGFSGITDVAGGFDAWTRNGLPTQR